MTDRIEPIEHYIEAYGFTFIVREDYLTGRHAGYDLYVLGNHLCAQPLELIERIYDTLRLYRHRLPELKEIEEEAFEDYSHDRYMHGLKPLSSPIRISGTHDCARDRERAKEAARAMLPKP